MLIAYTLVRRLMRQMAEHLQVAPLRIGFHVAAIAIIDVLRFAPLESATTLPRRLALLFEQCPIVRHSRAALGAFIPKSGQTKIQQIHNKNASPFLTDWYYSQDGFFMSSRKARRGWMAANPSAHAPRSPDRSLTCAVEPSTRFAGGVHCWRRWRRPAPSRYPGSRSRSAPGRCGA